MGHEQNKLLPLISTPTSLLTATWAPIGEVFGWRVFLREHLRSKFGLISTIFIISVYGVFGIIGSF